MKRKKERKKASQEALCILDLRFATTHLNFLLVLYIYCIYKNVRLPENNVYSLYIFNATAYLYADDCNFLFLLSRGSRAYFGFLQRIHSADYGFPVG